MQSTKKYISTPSSPQKFQGMFIGYQINRRNNNNRISPVHVNTSRRQNSLNINNKPLPCDFKAKNLDIKLADFFYKRKRPRPRALAPRNLDEYLKKNKLPKIQSKQNSQICKTMVSIEMEQDIYEPQYIRQVSKTIASQQYNMNQNQSKNLYNRKLRRYSIKQSKIYDSIKQQINMITNQGWKC